MYYQVEIDDEKYIVLNTMNPHEYDVQNLYNMQKSKENIPYKKFSMKDIMQINENKLILNQSQQKLATYMRKKKVPEYLVEDMLQEFTVDTMHDGVKETLDKWTQILLDVLKVKNIDEANEMIGYVQEFINNTPMFANKGYTPIEMRSLNGIGNIPEKIIPFNVLRK